MPVFLVPLAVGAALWFSVASNPFGSSKPMSLVREVLKTISNLSDELSHFNRCYASLPEKEKQEWSMTQKELSAFQATLKKKGGFWNSFCLTKSQALQNWLAKKQLIKNLEFDLSHTDYKLNAQDAQIIQQVLLVLQRILLNLANYRLGGGGRKKLSSKKKTTTQSTSPSANKKSRKTRPNTKKK